MTDGTNIKKCQLCGGTGKSRTTRGAPCPRCKGTGEDPGEPVKPRKPPKPADPGGNILGPGTVEPKTLKEGGGHLPPLFGPNRKKKFGPGF